MKTKETSTRILALKWFNSKSQLEQHLLLDKYFNSKSPSLLTIEYIEEIYNKEILEPKRQEEWQESQVNCRYSKPNQKQLIGNPSVGTNAKQFDESLFQKYIDKFDDEGLDKAKRLIEAKQFIRTLNK